ncbi:24696_t:CDS:1, partial [Entrophospora sp. SA101]
WALKFDYISCLGISYTEKKSTWFCISNNVNLNEDELINNLT